MTLFTALVFSSPLLFAQKGDLSEANKSYQEHSYVHAAELYEEMAESGYESEELFEKLGNSYYFNASYSEAAKYYSKLFAINAEKEAILVLRYAQSLKAIGEKEKGEEYFGIYQEALAGKKSGNNSESNLQALLEINSGKFSIEEISINSSGMDYGAATNPQGQLIFASTRDTGVVRRTLSTNDDLSLLDLYIAADPKSSNSVKKLRGDINTPMHESSAALSEDGNTMYFTRSRERVGKDSISTLGIYRAQLKDDKWVNVENLSINSNQFSNAHPALSADGKLLYFSSDRPGGFGQSDLYKVEIFEDNSFGEPVNLGGMINTIGKESFPFVDSEDHLYFSSDAHYGHGGMDVFFWNPSDETATVPINLGMPLNSLADDFAFSIDATGSGYFSSNRGGKDYDNIYSLEQQQPLEQVNGNQISDPDKSVSLTESEKGNQKVYAVSEPSNKNEESKKDKAEEREDGEKKQMREVELESGQNIFEQDKGDDLTNVTSAGAIYFELDKAEIHPDTALQLDKVFAFMKNKPEVKIEIRSHTDSRGSKVYNQQLSERRAKATMDYLLQKGIEAARLSYKGFGETQLVNNCTDGNPCSEKQHQENRRIEFVLLP